MHGRVSNLSDLVHNKVVSQIVAVGDERLPADLVLPCIGLPPNKTSINKLVGPEQVDENNRIKVDILVLVPLLKLITILGNRVPISTRTPQSVCYRRL